MIAKKTTGGKGKRGGKGKAPWASPKAKAVTPLVTAEEKMAPDEKKSCNPEPGQVTLSSLDAPGDNAQAKENNVTLTLKGLDKRGRNAIYTGAAVSLRFPVGAFPDKTAPPTTIEVAGVAGPKAAKPKMTAEERKAARAAQPKLTLAEKVAAAEKRTAALRAKLAAGEGAAASL